MAFHMKHRVRLAGAATAALLAGSPALAVDLTLMINSNNNEGAIMAEFAERYKEVAPDVNITINNVGYDVIRDQLGSQLEAGTGPDLALVTNLGGFNPYYVDLTPHVDAAAWEEAYGSVLPWYRAGNPDGIYGFHTELTVTGPFVNRTAFEEAGVELPAAGATWDDWADATRQVMENAGTYAGMVMDRSGHRMAGPAMSYGAEYYDADGNVVIDDGFVTFAQKMVDWHEEGLMPPDIWPAVSGAKYANGNEMFFSGDVPFYMAGSWAVGAVAENVGDKFDWAVVPVPCGPAGCGVMPGGAGLVAFKDGADPEAAAKFVAWMGEEENAREWYGRNVSIPAHAGIQETGIGYTEFGAGPKVSEALNIFSEAAVRAAEETPQAYQLQGDPNNTVIFTSTVQYLSSVINGELTMDEAVEKIRADVAKTQ